MSEPARINADELLVTAVVHVTGGDTSRMKPSLSSLLMSDLNSLSNCLPTFVATSPSVARPSIAESTARSGRDSWLVLPDASCTPLPDLEKMAVGFILCALFYRLVGAPVAPAAGGLDHEHVADYDHADAHDVDHVARR